MNGESTNGAERVDRVLVVVLREEEHAGLPLQRARRPTARIGAFGADATRTSCVNWKLSSVLLRRDERQRRVVEVGRVLGLPVHEPVVDDRLTRAPSCAVEHRRAEDVAIGVPLEVARDVERIGAQAAEIAQRVVAVARALAGHDDPRLPDRATASTAAAPCRRTPIARVEVVARDVVHGVAVALAVLHGDRRRRACRPRPARRRCRAPRAHEVARAAPRGCRSSPTATAARW